MPRKSLCNLRKSGYFRGMHEQSRETNRTFFLAESFVNYTSRNIFLTGKAGTGKTTFLRHIVASTPKKVAVAAPTGIAAINAEGMTLHSLFQLPFGPFIPDNGVAGEGVNTKSNMLSKMRFHGAKRKLIRGLELLIIDEISMVRADMLDAVDAVLRFIRKRNHEPFGGLQVLMIGDLFQLPPVVPDSDWRLLNKYYQTPYFFSAKVLADEQPVCIELNKIYRQTDMEFVDLLNKVRMNQVSSGDLLWLNEFLDADFEPELNENFITLTTHNKKADFINQTRIHQLTTKAFQYVAKVEGDFPENAYPVAQRLELKEGAQVMFAKNDREDPRRYYNGKIGVVSHLSKEEIRVRFPEEDVEITVDLEEWRNVRYALVEEKNELEEEVLGAYRQYPLKLAWAITIHKSQGLTFEKAIVDAGASFSAGQVYVALSRLVSMEGLVLKSKVTQDSIYTDRNIVHFSNGLQDDAALESLLEEARQQYIRKTLVETFDWEELLDVVVQLREFVQNSNITFKDSANEFIAALQQTLITQRTTARKFVRQLINIFHKDDMGFLADRTAKAVAYFEEQLEKPVQLELNAHEAKVIGKKNTKSYLKNLLLIKVKVTTKLEQLERAGLLASGLANGAASEELLLAATEHKLEEREKLVKMVAENKPTQQVKGASQRMSFEMFQDGKTVGEIAAERDLAIGTIEGHLAQFVKSGELSVFEVVGEKKVEDIMAAIEQVDSQSSSDIKKVMSDEYTYGEIRAVISHLNRSGEG